VTARPALVAIGLAAAVLLSEAFLRFAPPRILTDFAGDLSIMNRPDWSTYTFRPGYRAEIVSPDGRTVSFRVNALGLRGPEVPPRRPGVRRIVVLGDSFMAGWQVAERETFAGRLEALLRDDGHDVEVINAGVNGMNLDEEANLYEMLRDRLRPDLLVWAIFVRNDLAAYDLRRALSSPPLHRRWSRLYLLWRAAKAARGRTDPPPAETDLPPADWLHAPPPDTTTLVGRYRDLMGCLEILLPPSPFVEKIRRETEAVARARLAPHRPDLVVLIPPAEAVDPRRTAEIRRLAGDRIDEIDLDRPIRWFVDLLRDAGLPFVDLTEDLRRAEEAGAETYLEWDGHWTAAGHDVAARAAARILATIIEG
jgi:lysophospholipase L1-like esterase